MTTLPVITSDEFRLLRIKEVDPIVNCDVVVFKLEVPEQEPEPRVNYYALSHTWGDGSQRSSILVNGSAFNITQNLHSALCELHRREETCHEWHWIDQICINQADDEEKSTQVRAMHRIYTCARGTLIWLGPGTEKTNMAMDNLRKLTDEMGKPPFPDDLQERMAIRHRLAPQNHPVWQAIYELYGLPWFNRVWIMQEVVLSRDAHVLCGSRILTWNTLGEFANAIFVIWPAVSLKARPDNQLQIVNGFVSCMQIHKLRTDSAARRLIPLLAATRDRETANPVDHIYGIAGMLPTEQRALLKIDYRLNYVDVVLLCCKVCIMNDPLLQFMDMAPSIGRQPGLPSWCPDLGFPASEPSRLSSYVGFQAGFNDWSQCRSQVRVLGTPWNAISVPGFRVDVVKTIVECEPRRQREPQEYAAALTAWEFNCRQLCEKTQPDQAGQADLQEAYARTLIADHWNGTSPVPPEYELRRVLVAGRTVRSEVASETQLDDQTYPVSSDETYRFHVAMGLQQGRRFFSTENGRIGLGPTRGQPGDIVCVFDSSASLRVLRTSKDSEEGALELVGEAYIRGFMDLKVTLRDHAAEIGPYENFVIV